MFKISIVETRSRRRLILEGQLLPPSIGELKSAWRRAGEDLQGRTLMIDLRNVTLISPDAEDALFELMRDGAKFSNGDVLTKHVLQRLCPKMQARWRKWRRRQNAAQGTDRVGSDVSISRISNVVQG
jgi:hypothetical protein